MMNKSLFAVVGLMAALAAACSGGSAVPSAVPPGSGPNGSRPGQGTATPGKIQHVVIMIQENRSFNDLFATFPGATGTTVGLEAVPSASPTTTPLTPTEFGDRQRRRFGAWSSHLGRRV